MANTMFTDKFRLLKIVVPPFIIIGVIIYGEIKGPQVYPGFLEAIKAPKIYFGKEIGFGGKIIEVQKNYILVRINREVAKVNLTLPKEKLNYEISGMGVFQKDQSLKQTKYHLSNLRIYKILLSLIPALLISYWFFKSYSFDLKDFIFKTKKVEN